MAYRDIIQRNCQLETTAFDWWPRFAYHYSDMTNIVSILSEGYLFSRMDAAARLLMHNDNASRKVIDMTDVNTTSFVRFYFRPKTPTQYYNEGYKHPQLRYDNDLYANAPVPVFLVFDLETLLSDPNTSFSAIGQAGHESVLQRGELSFSELNFAAIYSSGPCSAETIKHRRAELAYPNAYAINKSLKRIVCRNGVEKQSLLNLLKIANRTVFDRYQSIISIAPPGFYENNGLYITDYVFQAPSASFTFSDTIHKKRYMERMMRKNGVGKLSSIDVLIELEWLSRKQVLYSTSCQTTIDYACSGLVLNNIPPHSKASMLCFRIYFDNALMGVLEQPLAPAVLL